MPDIKKLKSNLTLHWTIVAMMLIILIAYNLICHSLGTEIQINMAEDQRILIRTIFYIITIILFPLVSLVRHILLRLNQTMPGNNPPKKRYLLTITVTLFLIETVGFFGFIMFILGDGYNTLYIFSALAALGVFVHRPRLEEYIEITNALKIRTGIE